MVRPLGNDTLSSVQDGPLVHPTSCNTSRGARFASDRTRHFRSQPTGCNSQGASHFFSFFGSHRIERHEQDQQLGDVRRGEHLANFQRVESFIGGFAQDQAQRIVYLAAKLPGLAAIGRIAPAAASSLGSMPSSGDRSAHSANARLLGRWDRRDFKAKTREMLVSKIRMQNERGHLLVEGSRVHARRSGRRFHR